MKISVNLFLVVMAAALLGACGIKPGEVSPPQGEDKDTFPRTYPSPTTFQRPGNT